MSFFAADNLAIHFGGIKAVDGVSFHGASAKTAWERTMEFLRKHLKK